MLDYSWLDSNGSTALTMKQRLDVELFTHAALHKAKTSIFLTNRLNNRKSPEDSGLFQVL